MSRCCCQFGCDMGVCKCHREGRHCSYQCGCLGCRNVQSPREYLLELQKEQQQYLQQYLAQQFQQPIAQAFPQPMAQAPQQFAPVLGPQAPFSEGTLYQLAKDVNRGGSTVLSNGDVIRVDTTRIQTLSRFICKFDDVNENWIEVSLDFLKQKE
eukprot:TRINITY_DN330_c1_g1_i1.p1 TRINITY_DN330_c1_g1~~TRINITY_DN330_c1_g1_i1.p1  ORF type:complete len:154 (+),score=34.02 TRINITY_DN330_c1_g1_i1:860-1321(+)